MGKRAAAHAGEFDPAAGDIINRAMVRLAPFMTCAPMPVRRSSTPRRALKTYRRGCRSEQRFGS